jgi:diguanylate cyclase (GGDEF)-like protein
MEVEESAVADVRASRRSRAGQTALLAVGGALAFAATLGAVRSAGDDLLDSQRLHLLAAGFALFTGTALLVAGLNRARREGRRRRYFVLFAAGAAIWLYGQGLGYLLTMGSTGPFDPRVEAIPLAFALPLTTWGTLGLSRPAAMDRRSANEAFADALLGVVSLLVVWVLGVIPNWAEVPDPLYSATRLDQFLLFLAAGAFVVLITFSRRPGSLPLSQLSLFIGGLLVILVSDLIGEIGPDRVTDVTVSILGYWLGFTLIVLMFWRSSTEAEPPQHLQLRMAIAVGVPFGLVLVAGLLLLATAQEVLPNASVLKVMPILWAIALLALGISRASAERSDRSRRYEASTQRLTRSAESGWIGALLRDSSEYVFVLDETGGIVYSSPRTQQMLVPAHRFQDLIPDSADTFDALLRGLWAGTVSLGPYEMRLRASDGRHRYVEAHLRLIQDVSFDGFVLTATDVSDARRLSETLDHQQRHDPLTDLLTKDGFVAELVTALRSGRTLGVAVLDINDLGVWNETLGRAGGDTILQGVAHRFDMMPEATAVGRISGDGFAMLVVDPNPEQAVESALERLASTLRGLLLPDDTEVDVSFRAGYSVTPPEVPAQQLLDQADVALRRARTSRRSRIVGFAAGMNDALVRRLATEQRIRDALANDRVLVHYQPIARLTDGAVTGLEALVRLQAADGTVIPPLEFISTAAYAGLLQDLDQRVRQTVAQDWPVLAEACRQDLRVNLNVNEMELNEALIKELIDLDLTDKVAIEVTEESLLSQPDEAVRALAAFRAVGGVVALDDFGTGYSSLSQLASLPCDVVKIDKSFIANMSESPATLSLVRATITLAHDLGLMTVAEGVETAEEATTLRALGCDRIQGYYLSRPQALVETIEWLQRKAAQR